MAERLPLKGKERNVRLEKDEREAVPLPRKKKTVL